MLSRRSRNQELTDLSGCFQIMSRPWDWELALPQVPLETRRPLDGPVARQVGPLVTRALTQHFNYIVSLRTHLIQDPDADVLTGLRQASTNAFTHVEICGPFLAGNPVRHGHAASQGGGSSRCLRKTDCQFLRSFPMER